MRPASREEVAVAVLGRSPWPGKVKTRLIPVLGPEGAAELQMSLIAGAVDTASKAHLGPVTVWLTDGDHPIVRTIRAGSVMVQPNGDLGARMLAAFEHAAGPALVIGTDCPAMTPRHLQDAADALIAGHDAVFIPAEDGGYVLIGLRAPVPSLFSDMPWGTDQVMSETRARLFRLGITRHELPALWDVDRPEDPRACARLGSCRSRPPPAERQKSFRVSSRWDKLRLQFEFAVAQRGDDAITPVGSEPVCC